MNQIRSRETRKDVRISVRFVADAGWADAEIRNVSAGGLMAVSSCPPSQGTYVEIRRESYSIVGRVVWSSNNSFGLESREKIVLADLAEPRPKKPATEEERRARPRDRRSAAVGRRALDEQAQASARHARTIDFVAVCLAGAAFAWVVAEQASRVLGAPLLTVSRTLNAASAK
jgi:hypothetical protein